MATIRKREAATSPRESAVVFNPEKALSGCLNSRDMVREMTQFFFHEVNDVFPQVRTARAKGDLAEVGRLGHRIKGTVVFLGAEPAAYAASRVERFCTHGNGTPAEAGEAVNALERECAVLEAALREHFGTLDGN